MRPVAQALPRRQGGHEHPTHVLPFARLPRRLAAPVAHGLTLLGPELAISLAAPGAKLRKQAHATPESPARRHLGLLRPPCLVAVGQNLGKYTRLREAMLFHDPPEYWTGESGGGTAQGKSRQRTVQVRGCGAQPRCLPPHVRFPRGGRPAQLTNACRGKLLPRAEHPCAYRGLWVPLKPLYLVTGAPRAVPCRNHDAQATRTWPSTCQSTPA